MATSRRRPSSLVAALAAGYLRHKEPLMGLQAERNNNNNNNNSSPWPTVLGNTVVTARLMS